MPPAENLRPRTQSQNMPSNRPLDRRRSSNRSSTKTRGIPSFHRRSGETSYSRRPRKPAIPAQEPIPLLLGFPNPFTFDVNISTYSGDRVMKRVLLDTGSDLNLISNTAYQDLGTQLDPISSTVQSLAGDCPIVGQTVLTWAFISVSRSLKTLQHDDFFVLASSERTAFDCILGHRWIVQHLNTFLALMHSHRPDRRWKQI